MRSGKCKDLALLPTIICLGRFRIPCRYIFNIRQLHQGFDSLAQLLEHWIFICRPVSNPMTGRKFFQLCFILLLWLSCCERGAHPRLDFTMPKIALCLHKWWLPWKGGVFLPSIICLGRFRIACRYIFNLWQLCRRVDSFPQCILIRADRVPIPRRKGNFFNYASFLYYSFYVIREGSDQTVI